MIVRDGDFRYDMETLWSGVRFPVLTSLHKDYFSHSNNYNALKSECSSPQWQGHCMDASVQNSCKHKNSPRSRITSQRDVPIFFVCVNKIPTTSHNLYDSLQVVTEE